MKMPEREREINLALKLIIETLSTFELAVGAKQKDGKVFPIIIDGKNGEQYWIKNEVFDDGK